MKNAKNVETSQNDPQARFFYSVPSAPEPWIEIQKVEDDESQDGTGGMASLPPQVKLGPGAHTVWAL